MAFRFLQSSLLAIQSAFVYILSPPLAIVHACRLAFEHVGPPQTVGGLLPHGYTVIYSAIVFIFFVLYTVLVLRFAPIWLHHLIPVFAGSVFLVIMALSILDFGAYFFLRPRQKRQYSRNLGNTIITVFVTVPLMTALYQWLWYPQQNQTMQQITNDEILQIQFPAVALLQRTDFSSQANLLPAYSKCFMGWYNDTARRCSPFKAANLTATTTCNCNETRSKSVIEDFNWLNTKYRYLSFQTPANLVSNEPTYLMMLQVFFNFNSTKAAQDSAFEPSPSLSIAVYDPSLNLLDALSKKHTRLIDINTLDTTTINLRITSRQTLGEDPVYDYNLQISSVPTRNLVCNAMDKVSYPCVSIIRLSFPTFSRTNVKEQSVMGWQDVYAAIGSYYSFVQFFSWVASGALWSV